jgi:hypothetical protein
MSASQVVRASPPRSVDEVQSTPLSQTESAALQGGSPDDCGPLEYAITGS